MKWRDMDNMMAASSQLLHQGGIIISDWFSEILPQHYHPHYTKSKQILSAKAYLGAYTASQKEAVSDLRLR